MSGRMKGVHSNDLATGANLVLTYSIIPYLMVSQMEYYFQGVRVHIEYGSALQ